MSPFKHIIWIPFSTCLHFGYTYLHVILQFSDWAVVNKTVFVMETGYVCWVVELNFYVLFRWTPDITVWPGLSQYSVLEYVLLYLHLSKMHHGLDFLDTGPWLPLVWSGGQHYCFIFRMSWVHISDQRVAVLYWVLLYILRDRCNDNISRHVCFVPYSFQFIFLYSSHYSVLYRLSYKQCTYIKCIT